MNVKDIVIWSFIVQALFNQIQQQPGLDERITIMEKMLLPLDDIIQMTHRTGENWAVTHAQRLLRLIQEIGVGLSYDASVLSYAAYLHDWGAFPAYLEKGVEHALRSRQVVEVEILPFLDLPLPAQQKLLEAIEYHDYRDLRMPQSTEALLLREADMLEFLGMIGIGREFARGPKDLQVCFRRVLDRRNGIETRFTVPRAREIAIIRLERMAQCLAWLEEESYGIL
jgi:HD superfamily phosphodiesterase